MKLRKLTGVMIVLYILFSGSAAAVLPPQVYEEYYKAAPEIIEILITDSKIRSVKGEHSKIIKMNCQAIVKRVFRSESGLVEGQEIKIIYQIKEHDEPVPGPKQPVFVQSGESYVAYLSKSNGCYVLSAGGKSFISPETYEKYYSDL